MSIYDRIIKLLAEHTGKDASEFTPETTFESLGIDSLETVEMVMELEEELGIKASAEELQFMELEEKVATIGELVKFVEKCVG